MCDSGKSFQALRESTGIRLLVLFLSFSVLLVVAAGTGVLIKDSFGVGERTSILTGSVLQGVLAFCVPAWLTARFASDHAGEFLCIDRSPGLRAYVGVIIVYLIALPAMNQLIVWNQQMHFPEWASGLEETLREWENANSSVSEIALSAGNVWQMLAGVTVIGIVTGFSEEIFFRGAMQNVFSDSGVRRGVAVWGAAIIFSAIHFQFFGFFPRLLMGAFFGYILVWTGSLWPAVFAHALNNSIVVVTAWISGNPDEDIIGEIGRVSDGSVPWAAVFSIVATVIFFLRLREFFFNRNSSNCKI